MQVALAISEHAWPVALVFLLMGLLSTRFVRATAYVWVLRLLGESKTKCRELLTRAMQRDLDLA
jgi:hypothetical protein